MEQISSVSTRYYALTRQKFPKIEVWGTWRKSKKKKRGLCCKARAGQAAREFD